MGTNLDILVCENFILHKKKQSEDLLKDYKNKFKLDQMLCKCGFVELKLQYSTKYSSKKFVS